MHRLFKNTLTLARASAENATQYGQQNIQHHDNDVTTAFLFYGNMIEILSLATCLKRVRVVFSVNLSFTNIQEKK